MHTLPWLTLDALQAGALLALAATFGVDALHRRDRMMAWLALACLLVSFRHSAGVFDYAAVFPHTFADRLQSAMGSLAFMAMSRALTLIFPGAFPRHFLLTFFGGILPNLFRCAFLNLDTPLARTLHGITLLMYLWACGVTIWVQFRAYRKRDHLGVRLLIGLLATMLPVALEVVARLFFDEAIRVSGVSLILLTISVGVSWVWVHTQDLEQRAHRLSEEIQTWRSLLPGIAWRHAEPTPLLDDLLGAGWRKAEGHLLRGKDGRVYTLHRTLLPHGEPLGWVEPLQEDFLRGDGFLRGWTVALGMETETFRVKAWLEAWGAQVEVWGTVPPREGPFPSLIVWAREPIILAIWREYDLVRRRCRWVQVGGATIDGPHVHLDQPLDSEPLRKALQQLLVLQ